MAKQRSYQEGVIKRYYEHQDTLMLNRLGEIVSELYLAEVPSKKEKLWDKAHKALLKTNAEKARIAKVVKAEFVEGADKLLRLQLDVGGAQKTCLAGIAQAYKPDKLAGRLVIYLANLKPRKMRFGESCGMILAAGTGGKNIFMLSVDTGARPGQRVT